MHSGDKFWIAIWTVILIAALATMKIFTSASMETDKKIVDSIKAGANPIAAACAIRPGSMSPTLCMSALDVTRRSKTNNHP